MHRLYSGIIPRSSLRTVQYRARVSLGGELGTSFGRPNGDLTTLVISAHVQLLQSVKELLLQFVRLYGLSATH
jgi:hypothetical protein